VDIVAIIRELLFSHDCVILPGFGGFIGNYSPARIEKESSTFYPPAKRISFNRNLNQNDGLLINRVAAVANVNYNDAKNLVEEFVSDVKRKLSRGEKVIFERIGTFVNNSEGNVQFEPDRDVNYNLNSYGLAPFQYQVLEGYDVRQRLIREPVEEVVRSVSIKRYLWRAAVIIPIIGALIAVPLTTDIFKTRVQVTSFNPLITTLIDSGSSEKAAEDKAPVPSSDSVKNELSGNTQSEQGVSAADISPQVPELPSEEYGIIAGSFKSELNALSLVNKLAGEGYSAEVIQGANGFYRVSAIRCRSLGEAESVKKRLETRYPGAWIVRLR